MTTKNTRKILSAIVAFVMILTCLVSPAMANPAEAQTPANTYEAVSTVVNPETGETTYAETSGMNPELDPDKEVTIMVQLEGETTFMQTSDLQLASANYDTQMAAMAKAEGRIASALGQSIEVEARYSLLFNGFSFSGQGWMIDAINELDGVTAFEAPVFELIEASASEDVNLTPSMGTSTGLVRATKAWELGYTGEGMVVAILDTGIHSTHEAFSVNPENGKIDKAYLQKVFDEHGSKLHCGTDANAMYYSAKMPFNWDYYDNDAIPNHTASEHGTHVAGIAAGNNGDNFKGVAPDAQIATFQVFDANGGASFATLIRALEDCVYLGVDAINMSLGIAAWFTDYDSIGGGIEAAYEALEEAGVAVCVAAGNDAHANYWTNASIGYDKGWFNWNIDYGTIGAPATFPGSFAVASAVNTSGEGSGYFIGYGKEYYPTAIAGNPNFGALENKEYDIVYVGLGSPEEIAAAGGVEGKIALAQRGVHTFTDKTIYASNAGAAGIIIFNNVSGAFNPSIASPIPFGAMTLEDGEALKANFADGVHGKITVNTGLAYKGLGMAVSSSWGTTADLKIKPEITAPGDGITSAVAWFYQSPYYPAGDHEYSTWSGTSMATPHVAGGMLLVKQRLKEVFPDKTAAEINELAHTFLMSTAHQVSGMVRQSGAGLMDLESALTTDAYITVPDCDRPKLELGESENGEFTLTFEVNNFGKSAITYDIVPSVLVETATDTVYRGYRENDPGFPEYNAKYGFFLRNPSETVVPYIKGAIKDATDLCEITGPKAVTVKAGETATIVMNIKASAALMEYIEKNFDAGTYLEGYVQLRNRAEGADLSVPYLGFIGDWDYAPMFDLGYWWNLPYGVNNMAQMPVTKGTYVGYGALNQGLGLNYYWDATGETYLADRNAISPNGDGFLESVNYAEFSLMRISKTVKAYIEDAEGNVLQVCHDSTYNFRKEYYVQGWNGGTTYSQLSWDFDATKLAENETVYLVLEAWLDHEGYDIADNMNGRMVFPFTVDTTAPAVTVIDGGIQILDTNYIAYYGVYADAHRTQLLFEDGIFAEERGVAETYMTDLDTYFVRVADYGRNEAFYMVKDGQVYELDADGFDHNTKTVFARQYINWNQGIYEYNWVTYNPETPEKLTFLQEPQYNIPDEAQPYGYDYKYGVVMPDGTVYVATTSTVYELNMETQETTEVCTVKYPEGATFGFIRGLMLRPGTDELYVFNQSNHTGATAFYVSRLDIETGETTPLFAAQDAWINNIAWILAWSATFIDNDTVCLDFGGRIVLVNLLTGEVEDNIDLGWNAPFGENQFGVDGTGGSLLYDETENALYFTGNIAWGGDGRYQQQAVFVYDLDTGLTDIRYYGTGLGYDLAGLFFLDDYTHEVDDDCIYYLQEVAPTCTAEGYTLHTCADCGKEYRDNFVPALGHTYEAVVTEPTCTEMGYTTYTCSVCGDSYVADYTLPIDHDFVEVVIEPTCTEAGYTIYMCECGYEVIDDVVDPVGHDYAVNVIEPTCEKFGYTEHICVDCGDYYVSSYTAPFCPSADFTDVALDAWYHEAVDFVIEAALMEGMGKGEFAPEANMTRAQLVTVLYRMAGEPTVEGLTNPFADVAADTWYTDAVIWAANVGVVNGTSETTFTPYANITREQLVAVLYRFYGEPEANTLVLADFADVDAISTYAVDAMAWAVENGVVNGITETTLAPRGTATRAQIAAILMRLIEG